MSLLTYKGAVSPAVYLCFRTKKNANAHADADDSQVYWVANECLKQWDIVADTGSRVIHIRRKAGKKRRLFDSKLNTYISSPISARDLNDIYDAEKAGTLKTHITVRLWYKTFFRRLVSWLTRETGDKHNIANPDDAKSIRNTFKHWRSKGRIRVKYKTGQEKLKDIPCLLYGWKVKTKPKGAPEVRFAVYMRIKEDLTTANEDKVAIPLIAADYSKIARYGKGASSPWVSDPSVADSGIEQCLKQWEINVFNYLFNKTDLKRGTSIRDDIVTKGLAQAAKPQLDIIRTVRDAIDKHLVTANAWHQPRESRKHEPLQHALSEVFGGICNTHFRASPVRMIRQMKKIQGIIKGGAEPAITFDQRVAMVLQFGAAHCGEHALTSYNILREMMMKNATVKTTLVSAIYSGNANIDHAFVVGGWQPDEIIKTKVNKSNNSKSSVGEDIKVFDLRKAIVASGDKPGYVCDPYLSRKSIGQTGIKLLAGLNSKRRRKRGKDTDFLSFGAVYPDTGVSEVVKPSVKNV